MIFPNIDPVIFSAGPLDIRWYGVAYALGFIMALYTAQKLCRVHLNTPIKERHIDAMLSYAIIGVIFGGRLGYVLFYNFDYYMANTFEIFKIWEGGMSFHGGFLGALFMLYLYAKKAGISFIYLTDRIAPGACLGLMFGRIANFINGELWGTPTDLPWGIIFPNADMLTRHPSQLYEALFEGLVLFIILFYFAKRTNRQGLVSSLFLIGYGVFRFAIEYTRQADDIDFLHKGIFEYISMGQLLSLPMIIVGSAMLYHVWKKKKEIDNAIQNSLDKHYKNIDAEVEAKKARKRLSTKRSK